MVLIERAVNSPSNVWKFFFAGRTKTHVCWLMLMHNSAGPMQRGRTSYSREILISLLPQDERAPPSSKEEAYVLSHWRIQSAFICQFYNLQKRGVGYIGPVWLINSAWAGEAKASKASIETKIFSGFWGIPCWETRFSSWLVRVFICPQVGKSWRRSNHTSKERWLHGRQRA